MKTYTLGKKSAVRLVLLGGYLLPFLALAQVSKASQNFPAATLINTEQRKLTSEIVGQEFELYISLPDGYAAGTDTYPVLYLTDGNTYFGLMADMARNLQWGGEMPEAIIVGIGYPLSGFPTDDERWGKWLAWRARDLTPTHNAQMDLDFAMAPLRSGGAPLFLQFLERELFPFIEKAYRARSTERTYAGFSLGGLFGLYALFEKPGMFANYILGSASIWYDQGAILASEKAYAEGHTDLAAHLFLSAGELEEEVNAGMVRRMLELSSMLKSRGYNGLHIQTAILEGETHMSAPSVSFQRGLRFLFRK